MSLFYVFFFFFKQKTAYEMRISDWSSDVCSSDLQLRVVEQVALGPSGGEPGERPYRRAGKSEDERQHGSDDQILVILFHEVRRSEERRVGKGCGSTFRSRWWRSH